MDQSLPSAEKMYPAPRRWSELSRSGTGRGRSQLFDRTPPASGIIAQQIAAALFTVEDATAKSEEARVRGIFEGLRRGEIDRTQFTLNANAYFDDVALRDFASSLAPLGPLTGFAQIRQSLRGGYIARTYRASFGSRSVRVWIFEQPDGKLEQLQVAPIG